jgi:hypothetical protein
LVSEGLVLSALVAALPEKYKSEVTKYAFNIAGGSKSTLKDLERLLQALWRFYDQAGQTSPGGKSGQSAEEDSDVVLGAFEGECYKCKQKGHKANDNNNKHYTGYHILNHLC